jgi:hypothetical protein
MTDKQENEQEQPQDEAREDEPVEEQDAPLLPDREATSVMGGETHGLGPPVP